MLSLKVSTDDGGQFPVKLDAVQSMLSRVTRLLPDQGGSMITTVAQSLESRGEMIIDRSRCSGSTSSCPSDIRHPHFGLLFTIIGSRNYIPKTADQHA